jgi:hypothetical protein
MKRCVIYITLRWLSKKCKRLINDYGEINLWALAYTDLTSNRRIWSSNLVRGGCSGDLLPPSPPAEKASACQDQGEDATPEESAERKFYARQLQGIRFTREEAAQAAKVADSTRPSALPIIWPA